MFKKIKLSKLIFLIFITTIVVAEISLSKYISTLSTNSSAQVAKWDNDLIIVADDTLYFNNNQANAETLNFNVISSSEVSTVFDITMNNIPKNIETLLQNNNNSSKFYFDNSQIKVSFDSSEEIFTIPNSNSSVTSGTITMTYRTITNGKSFTFESSQSDRIITATIMNGEDEANVTFKNFGSFNPGANQIMAHTAVFTTSAIELAGITEIELYATFEQVD